MPTRCINALKINGTIKTHGRTSRLILSESSVGAKGFTLGLNVTKAGGMSPEDVHADSQEAMYFISGKGEITIGDDTYDVGPDTVTFVPAGVPHEIRNTGDEDIKFVWFYCPGLPSQK